MVTIPITDEICKAIAIAEQNRNNTPAQAPKPAEVVAVLEKAGNQDGLTAKQIASQLSPKKKDHHTPRPKQAASHVQRSKEQHSRFISQARQNPQTKAHQPNHKPAGYRNQANDGRMDFVGIARRTLTRINGFSSSPKAREEKISLAFGNSGPEGTSISRSENEVEEIVNSPETLIRLLEGIPHTDVREEYKYCGEDCGAVKLFTCRLPKEYTAKVGAVYIDDVPSELFSEAAVKVTLEHDCRNYRNPATFYGYSCPSMFPVSSRATPDYHVISIKINRKDLTLNSWKPGPHHLRAPNSGLVEIGR
jgi:hypothetical protein